MGDTLLQTNKSYTQKHDAQHQDENIFSSLYHTAQHEAKVWNGLSPLVTVGTSSAVAYAISFTYIKPRMLCEGSGHFLSKLKWIAGSKFQKFLQTAEQSRLNSTPSPQASRLFYLSAVGANAFTFINGGVQEVANTNRMSSSAFYAVANGTAAYVDTLSNQAHRRAAAGLVSGLKFLGSLSQATAGWIGDAKTDPATGDKTYTRRWEEFFRGGFSAARDLMQLVQLYATGSTETTLGVWAKRFSKAVTFFGCADAVHCHLADFNGIGFVRGLSKDAAVLSLAFGNDYGSLAKPHVSGAREALTAMSRIEKIKFRSKFAIIAAIGGYIWYKVSGKPAMDKLTFAHTSKN